MVPTTFGARPILITGLQCDNKIVLAVIIINYNVIGAVFISQPSLEFIRFTWWMWNSTGQPWILVILLMCTPHSTCYR